MKALFKRIFTPEICKAFLYAFYSFLIACLVVGLFGLGYYSGHVNAITEIGNKHETNLPMCASKNTEVRENPTGYVLSKVNRGDVMWVVQLQVPFAVVWYARGGDWYLGTTTASSLVPCEFIVRDAL